MSRSSKRPNKRNGVVENLISSDEEPFLAEIDAHPDDRMARLVYADWLDERGDVRGEMVRLEEEMRDLPAYSDRYWQLKPRRNALREGCDEAWRERMRYGTDYLPVFGHGVPDGVRERWRLIREFVERWHGFSMPDVGGWEPQIEGAEHRTGRKLPPAVREWIAFCHELIEQDHWILRDCTDDGWTWEEKIGAFALLLQGEGDYYWAVRPENLDQNDPPVDGYGTDYEGGNEDAFVPDRQVAASVTAFVLTHLSWYANGRGGSSSKNVKRPKALLESLRREFAVHARIGDLEIFELPNIFATFDQSPLVGGFFLEANYWKKLSPAEIPQCLRR